MKKTVTAITLLAGAVAGYSQGTVNFTTYDPGVYVQRIFAPSSGANTPVTYGGYTVTEEIGSTASGSLPKEKPTGTTVYSGAALTGTGYSAQLLAAPGSGDALGTLSPIGAPMNFEAAGADAGLINQTGPSSTTTPATPNTGANGAATFAIAAWAGPYASLALAQAAGANWGISPVVSLSETGGGSITAPTLFGTAGVTYTGTPTSFSLGTSVPEPSTIALGVMGASALLFRRKK